MTIMIAVWPFLIIMVSRHTAGLGKVGSTMMIIIVVMITMILIILIITIANVVDLVIVIAIKNHTHHHNPR